VRFGYFQNAFLGDESQWAAEASECASDQNKFWEFHDLIFSNQNGENQGAFSKENLQKLAEQLKLDMKAYNECMDTGKYTQIVQQQTSLAKQIGVQSTPSFVINGTPLVGGQPFQAFQQIIDQFLK
jgi:protein-disulfide isomerase